jgi:hypothetical protein
MALKFKEERNAGGAAKPVIEASSYNNYIEMVPS